MSTESTLDTLNDLIEVCKDGEYGFRMSAEHARGAALRQSFSSRAVECADAAARLTSHVVRLGGKAETGGTASGAMHRGWVAVKSTLTGYSDLRILEEAERGEDVAVKRYAKALQADLPTDVRAVVEAQFRGVQRNHDLMRAQRNEARMSKV